MGGQEHFYLETNSVLVIPRMEDKEMDVYVSTQHATDVQKLVASALNLQVQQNYVSHETCWWSIWWEDN